MAEIDPYKPPRSPIGTMPPDLPISPNFRAGCKAVLIGAAVFVGLEILLGFGVVWLTPPSPLGFGVPPVLEWASLGMGILAGWRSIQRASSRR